MKTNSKPTLQNLFLFVQRLTLGCVECFWFVSDRVCVCFFASRYMWVVGRAINQETQSSFAARFAALFAVLFAVRSAMPSAVCFAVSFAVQCALVVRFGVGCVVRFRERTTAGCERYNGSGMVRLVGLEG